jgi:hypothetical protein
MVDDDDGVVVTLTTTPVELVVVGFPLTSIAPGRSTITGGGRLCVGSVVATAPADVATPPGGNSAGKGRAKRATARFDRGSIGQAERLDGKVEDYEQPEGGRNVGKQSKDEILSAPLTATYSARLQTTGT